MKKIVFNPFEKYSTNSLFAVGLIFNLLGTFLGFLLNVNFDGALDVHFSKNISAFDTSLNCVINLSCLVLFFYISAKLINEKTRFIDVLVFILLARIPLYLISFFNVNNLQYEISEKVIANVLVKKSISLSAFDMSFLIISAIVSLLIVVWYAILLFNGFKVSSNAKGEKGVLFFIVALVLAELSSKYLISVI